MVNAIEQFFDEQAKTWDDIECHTDEEKKNLLNQLNLKENDKVIDIACGTGVITRLIHQYTKSNVLGIDISNNMILKAKDKSAHRKRRRFGSSDGGACFAEGGTGGKSEELPAYARYGTECCRCYRLCN